MADVQGEAARGRVQGFKGSGVKRFRGSKVQGLGFGWTFP